MSKQLIEVYESGVAVEESPEEERARLTAELADLRRQWEPVRRAQVPVLSAPGGDFGPVKRKLALEIAIAEREIRLGELRREDAAVDLDRVRAEVVEVDAAAEVEAVKQRIQSLREQVAEAEQEQRKLENAQYTHKEAIREAERSVNRAAGEIADLRALLPKLRQKLASAEEIEAIKRHNRQEDREIQQRLAG